MDVDLLKTFLEVHKTRHFGRAAENLFITQSAVSARIRQLEEILGVQLFNRDRKNIKPTAAGEKLIKHAETIIAMWNRIKLDVAGEEHGRISIVVGAVSSLWDIYMPRWLKDISTGLDKILLTCNVVSSDQVHRQIVDGTLDLAFTYEPPQLDRIHIIQTIPIRFLLVASKADQDCATAMQTGYVYVDWGTPFSITHSQFYYNNPSPVLRLALGRVARDYIIKTGGSAYLPDTMVKRDIDKGRLHLVKDAPVIERNAYLIINRDNQHYQRIIRLMQ